MENFELDGFYIIAPERAKKSSSGGLDTQIVSLHFLDESLLVAITSSHEIRVMNTQKFKEKDFVPPPHLQEIDFKTLTDSRVQMMPIGSPLTEE